MKGIRKTEKLVDGKFIEFEFDNLKKGDTFRMFESDDGTPVVNGKGETEWVVKKILLKLPETVIETV